VLPTQPWEPHIIPVTLECCKHDISEGLDAFEIAIPTDQHTKIKCNDVESIYVVALDCFDEDVDGVDEDMYFDMKLVAALRNDTRITDDQITDRNGERVPRSW
jgi:hypothetical protein